MYFFEERKEYKQHILAVEDSGKQITYGEFDTIAKNIESFMPKRALAFLLCKNTLGALVAYLTCLRNGVVPLLLDARINKNMFDQLMAAYRPELLLVPKSMMAISPKATVILEKFDYFFMVTGEKTISKLHEDLALLLTTSGSTGSKKFVRQSYRNLQSNAESIAEYLKLTAAERPITSLPMSYTYGLSVIHSHMLVGATLLLTDYSLVEKGFWDFFTEWQATSFAGVPYTYEMLDKLHVFNMKMPSLRTMTQAGGKLSVNLQEKFTKFAAENHKEFVVMYGQAEATARMAYLPFDHALEKIGSMGIPIPGGQFFLIGADGQVITENNTVGELVYKGKNVTMGYANGREDLQKGDEWRGLLVTGDMAKRDRDGYYYIVGRKKRFLKVFGNRVNLDEIEQLLKVNFTNAEFACNGEDDHIRIFTTCKDLNTIKALKTYLAKQTSLNIKAFEVATIPCIPKNNSGKTLYTELPASRQI